MNLFDKIKDAFDGEGEKHHQEEAAPAPQAEPAAQAEYVPESPAAAEAQAEADAQAAQVEADAQAQAQQVADEVAAIERQQAEQVAAEQAAAQQAQAAAEPPLLSVAYLRQLIDHDSDPNVATGDALDAVAGGMAERALAQVVDYAGPVDGALGTSFVEAYARYQESLGYSGSDADGYPGLASLAALGERTGEFRAVD